MWPHRKSYSTFDIQENSSWLWGVERYCCEVDVRCLSSTAGRSTGYITSQTAVQRAITQAQGIRYYISTSKRQQAINTYLHFFLIYSAKSVQFMELGASAIPISICFFLNSTHTICKWGCFKYLSQFMEIKYTRIILADQRFGKYFEWQRCWIKRLDALNLGVATAANLTMLTEASKWIQTEQASVSNVIRETWELDFMRRPRNLSHGFMSNGSWEKLSTSPVDSFWLLPFLWIIAPPSAERRALHHFSLCSVLWYTCVCPTRWFCTFVAWMCVNMYVGSGVIVWIKFSEAEEFFYCL